ncbi:uncharacterized protein LOC129907201 [Episyrphus balteatus]|uniref:uncharacterized protein LOC129907201 n=1 Tax=Episyrphus balteatus TaxID=286459 RepID=UPI0024868322|nr:uncharacterized protein LOC129907201 [Episyrphus balteatus]
MSLMNELIRSNVPNNPELVETIHLGYEKCAKEILSKLKEFEANRENIGKSKNKAYQGLKTPCSPFAVLVSYCALRHTFLNCPKNSWINTEVCNNARNYVNNCEPAQFGGPRHRERKTGKSKTKIATTATVRNK